MSEDGRAAILALQCSPVTESARWVREGGRVGKSFLNEEPKAERAKAEGRSVIGWLNDGTNESS